MFFKLTNATLSKRASAPQPVCSTSVKDRRIKEGCNDLLLSFSNGFSFRRLSREQSCRQPHCVYDVTLIHLQELT